MKIPMPILSVAVTAAITVTACGTRPVIHDSGPSPTFNTRVQSACDDGTEIPGYPPPTPCPPTTSAVAALERGRDLASREKLRRTGELGVPPTVDLELVEAAQKDRVPFTFSVDPGGCAWVRTPDGALWSLNGTGGALVRDSEHERLFRETPGARVTIGCTTRGVAASVPVGLDRAAADAAGTPWRWTDHCQVFVRTGGRDFAPPKTVTVHGEALRITVPDPECAGVERPGGAR